MRARISSRPWLFVVLALLVLLFAGCTVQYGPALSNAPSVLRYVPTLTGLSGERRYLVLALDPAELRPAGGYSGTVGVVGLNRGRLVERSFGDVNLIDFKPGLPYVEPPEALQKFLPGLDSWDLADAAWSPDFPTAAQDSLRIYEIETGDTNIDGVITLTTDAVDKLLEVIGPVTVADYGVTVNAGQTTLISLGLTRGVSTGSFDRKAFLDALAGAVIKKLVSLPPWKMTQLADVFNSISARRDAMVWLKDPAAEAWVATSPMGGAVGQQAGDYIYVVESNVEPPSKYNLVVSRADTIDVTLDTAGNASDSIAMAWHNYAMSPGPMFQLIRYFSQSQAGLYGAYVRLLTPSSSTFDSVGGQGADTIYATDEQSTEAQRNVFGNYLLIPPGTASLAYSWSVPNAATSSQGVWTYDLTIQRQPGSAETPIALTVQLPTGAQVLSTTSGTANVNTVTLNAKLDQDLALEVRYKLP